MQGMTTLTKLIRVLERGERPLGGERELIRRAWVYWELFVLIFLAICRADNYPSFKTELVSVLWINLIFFDRNINDYGLQIS